MRHSKPFTFKRFTINQQRAAMKVGTDGVLLGAWCTVDENIKRALDIGTGTGVIALMLAQRGEGWNLKVDAVEPEPGAFADATNNISASPWNGNISVSDKPIQLFCGEKYDLIVCNPPYFTASLLPPSESRITARHDVNLGREELVKSAAALCAAGGRFAVIIPYEQAGGYIIECDMKGFGLSRRTDIKTTVSTPAKRTLLEFIYGPVQNMDCEYDGLIIETSPLEYTEQYRALTRDFYLKF